MPIKVSLYDSLAGSFAGPRASTAVVTTSWSDAISGVVTERIACLPGNYVIVPSTSRAGFGKRFSIFVYSDACPVTLTSAAEYFNSS